MCALDPQHPGVCCPPPMWGVPGPVVGCLRVQGIDQIQGTFLGKKPSPPKTLTTCHQPLCGRLPALRLSRVHGGLFCSPEGPSLPNQAGGAASGNRCPTGIRDTEQEGAALLSDPTATWSCRDVCQAFSQVPAAKHLTTTLMDLIPTLTCGLTRTCMCQGMSWGCPADSRAHSLHWTSSSFLPSHPGLWT